MIHLCEYSNGSKYLNLRFHTLLLHAQIYCFSFFFLPILILKSANGSFLRRIFFLFPSLNYVSNNMKTKRIDATLIYSC